MMDYARRFWLAVPAACLAMMLSQAQAQAAFTVSINGTIVATDNGAGDSNPDVGLIEYINDLLGYNFRIATSTNFSSPDIGDITSSELRIVNNAGTSDLTISVQEQFVQPTFIAGSGIITQSFTRNLSSTGGTSGTVSLTTTATSASGGGTGSAPTITFSGMVGSDINNGSFNRTSALYTLTQTITINGLNMSDNVLLTANSNVTNPDVSPVPTPGSLVLLLTAIPVIGLCRSRLLRRKMSA
jgi:hypothetical protein